MHERGQGGPDVSDNEHRFFGVFLEEESETYQLLFTSSDILILTKVITGRRSLLM